MINDHSLQVARQARFSDAFIKPQYDTYCFSRIPPAITQLLTGEPTAGLPAEVFGALPQRYDRVVLLLVDAFGWRFWERYAEQFPLLRRVAGEGVVSKLTAQFPSTTAAHVTCIHTGLTPAASGVYEWFYYEPRLDAVIAPLLFSFAGDKQRNTLVQTGVAPGDILPRGSLYTNLRRHGVTPYAFQPGEFTPSPYSDAVMRGLAPSDVFGYRTLPEALTNLADLLLHRRERAYYYLYAPSIDTVGHYYGPDSQQFDAEVDAFWTTVERLFYAKVAGKLQDTLLLITADHGQVETDPRTTFYLNRELDGARLARYLRTDHGGAPLVPAGSPRDMFLYIHDAYLDEAQRYLETRLTGRAEVCQTRDLIDQGFFGAEPPSQAFLGRAGNLVILPYRGETVWWYEQGRFQQSFFGHHGGLTPEEMETIFLCLPLG